MYLLTDLSIKREYIYIYITIPSVQKYCNHVFNEANRPLSFFLFTESMKINTDKEAQTLQSQHMLKAAQENGFFRYVSLNSKWIRVHDVHPHM